MPVELQVVIIYAVINNYLADVKVDDVAAYQQGLFEHMRAVYPNVLKDITDTGDLSKENEQTLKNAISEFSEKFVSEH